MSREDASMKARRLLVEGRLVVGRVDRSEIEASCRGDSGAVYRLGFASGRWFCTCPAFRECSHLKCLWLVTIRPSRSTS